MEIMILWHIIDTEREGGREGGAASTLAYVLDGYVLVTPRGSRHAARPRNAGRYVRKHRSKPPSSPSSHAQTLLWAHPIPR